jgi:hypothetical protein
MIHFTYGFPKLRAATKRMMEKPICIQYAPLIDPLLLNPSFSFSLCNFRCVGGVREGEGAVGRGGGILEAEETAGSIPFLL